MENIINLIQMYSLEFLMQNLELIENDSLPSGIQQNWGSMASIGFAHKTLKSRMNPKAHLTVDKSKDVAKASYCLLLTI